jgi:hypothetical protein
MTRGLSSSLDLLGGHLLRQAKIGQGLGDLPEPNGVKTERWDSFEAGDMVAPESDCPSANFILFEKRTRRLEVLRKSRDMGQRRHLPPGPRVAGKLISDSDSKKCAFA